MTEITFDEMMYETKMWLAYPRNNVHYKNVKRMLDAIPRVYDEASHTAGIEKIYCYLADNHLLAEDDYDGK